MGIRRLWPLALVGCVASCDALTTLTQDPSAGLGEADALARRKGEILPPVTANVPLPVKDRLGLPSLPPLPSPTVASPSPSPSPVPSPLTSPALMSRACDQLTCLTQEQVGSQFMIYLQPGVHTDLTVGLRWTLNNMVADFQATDPVVLKAGQKTLVGKLRFASSAGGTYAVNTTGVRYGDVAVTQDSYVYGLPWRAGETYTCGNAWNGFGAHTGDYGYAVDYLMPVGTPVTAARDGVVFAIENRYSQGGNDSSLGDKANYAYIRHDNGTYGRYLHFKQNGVVVAVGQPVRRGQVIGYSGNTGWSTAPHLHFDVMTAQSVTRDRTLGVKFQVQANAPAGENPVKDRAYTAF